MKPPVQAGLMDEALLIVTATTDDAPIHHIPTGCAALSA
jgi:hypothetical protein